jgi:8-oxo-dGTP diphosphatase
MLSVSRTKPQDFTPVVEVASCYIEFEGKFLFLKRAPEKPEGGRFGVPAGKIEEGESVREAVLRETFEETGICLDEAKLRFAGTIFFQKPCGDFSYHIHYLEYTFLPHIVLNREHTEYRWLSIDETANFPMMSGAIEALDHLKALLNQPI